MNDTNRGRAWPPRNRRVGVTRKAPMSSADRIKRLMRLVVLLQSGRAYNTKQLAEQCRVTRRTIFRDLKTLEQSGYHVHYNHERQGFSLPAPTFLPPTDFTLDETLSLLLLSHELGHEERGIPFQQPARSAALKLLSNLPRHLREYVGELTRSISVRLDSRSPLDQSQPHYELLMQALVHRRQVRIRYHSLTEEDGGEISTLLSPYRMVFLRRSWYVIGRSSLHREVRTFNVGRIRQAELLDSSYRIPPRFSLDRYLGNAWFLIREPGKRYHVTVRFQKLVAQNVAEVQWHKTQQVHWNGDGTLDFHVEVDSLKEIIWWILGYGDQAEVLQPKELREQVKQRVAAMYEIYNQPPRPPRTAK